MALLLSTVQRMVEVPILGIDQTPRLATVVGLTAVAAPHGLVATHRGLVAAELAGLLAVRRRRGAGATRSGSRRCSPVCWRSIPSTTPDPPGPAPGTDKEA
jgi:hypothetical protein